MGGQAQARGSCSVSGLWVQVPKIPTNWSQSRAMWVLASDMKGLS